MDNFVDYYELLHVQPTAPAVVIKASYRTMMQKLNHHPDRGGDVAFAQLLNRAVETLCNRDARAQYDLLRQQMMGMTTDEKPGPGGSDKSSEYTWGEPGGSPNRASDEHRTRSNEATVHGKSSLPAKPHCLFCLTPHATNDPANNRAAGSAYAHASRCSCCNGARTPIQQLPASSNEELRRMHRYHHNSAAQLWTTWPAATAIQVMLTDFSPNGCALNTQQPLHTGQVVMIDTPLFNAVCIVRHCRSAQPNHETSERFSRQQPAYTAGLAFVTLDMQATPGTLLHATA